MKVGSVRASCAPCHGQRHQYGSKADHVTKRPIQFRNYWPRHGVLYARSALPCGVFSEWALLYYLVLLCRIAHHAFQCYLTWRTWPPHLLHFKRGPGRFLAVPTFPFCVDRLVDHQWLVACLPEHSIPRWREHMTWAESCRYWPLAYAAYLHFERQACLGVLIIRSEGNSTVTLPRFWQLESRRVFWTCSSGIPSTCWHRMLSLGIAASAGGSTVVG